MKQMLLFTALAIGAIACTKTAGEPSLNDPGTAAHQHTQNGGMFVAEQLLYVPGRNAVTVNVKAMPRVVCESYADGETPRPCNIYIDFTCTLSEPVNSYVRVELERSNILQVSEEPAESETSSGVKNINFPDGGARSVLTIPPNNTVTTYNSMLLNSNNTSIKDNDFKIVNVSLYTPNN